MKETLKGLIGSVCPSLSRLLAAVHLAGSIATAGRFGIRSSRKATGFAVIVTSTVYLALHITFKA
jgi:hypothetical protein